MDSYFDNIFTKTNGNSPNVGIKQDLLMADKLARSMTVNKQVAAVKERQKRYDEKLDALSTKIAAADQDMILKLNGLQNAVGDLGGKVDRMQLDSAHARDDHRIHGLLVGTHDDQLRDLRRDLDAERGRLDGLAAENRRLSGEVTSLRDRVQLQDRRIAVMIGVFVAFLAFLVFY
ncbi:hypothetical protein AAVH_28207 [Aphelenchoides avenae]|nr:hypothetical protein AAVH_28207 [Aphelenchus avenae]